MHCYNGIRVMKKITIEVLQYIKLLQSLVVNLVIFINATALYLPQILTEMTLGHLTGASLKVNPSLTALKTIQGVQFT